MPDNICKENKERQLFLLPTSMQLSSQTVGHMCSPIAIVIILTVPEVRLTMGTCTTTTTRCGRSFCHLAPSAEVFPLRHQHYAIPLSFVLVLFVGACKTSPPVPTQTDTTILNPEISPKNGGWPDFTEILVNSCMTTIKFY